MSVVSTDVPKEMDEQLKLLVATGLYKSKSEALRDAIRNLAYKYRDEIKNVRSVRKRLDKKMGDKNLSSVLEDVRNEE
ncbi:MAG: ribbon-helix-helix protein, CopG family [Thermoplasmatota archaeon]